MAAKHTFFQRQEQGELDQAFSRALAQALTSIDAAGAVPTAANANTNPIVLNQQMRFAVYNKLGIADQNEKKRGIAGHKIGTTDWRVLYRDAPANTKEALMIANVGQNISVYFSWMISAEQRHALNGTWEPPEEVDNTVDFTNTTPLKFAHNDKHFGAQPNEAQYTIGANQAQRKLIVAGMEEKAMRWGSFMGGESFFRFDQVVGTDGQRPQQTTCSIRVDTPGGPSQHSHPIPENQVGMVSHDTKIRSAIRFHTTEKSIEGLVLVAKYLKVIGSAQHAYTNLRNDPAFGDGRPPESHYWRW
jgi:hypothetical protein